MLWDQKLQQKTEHGSLREAVVENWTGSEKPSSGPHQAHCRGTFVVEAGLSCPHRLIHGFCLPRQGLRRGQEKGDLGSSPSLTVILEQIPALWWTPFPVWKQT